MTTTIEPGSLVVVDKTPSEIEDFEIDWSQRGLGTDTIASSSWATSGDLQIANSPAPTFTNTTATAFLAAGIAGLSYVVTNTITTAGGRTLEESFVCNCIQFRLIVN